MTDHISPDQLKRLVSYDPATGALLWLPRDADMFEDSESQTKEHSAAVFNGKYALKPAFSGVNSWGYNQGSLLGKYVKAHRVAWAIYYSDWPSGEIDHINGIRTDNRIANLRLATRRTQNRNRALPSTNTSGFHGVSVRRGKWIARIGHENKTMELGAYNTKAEAIAARRAAEKILGYHANHGRKTP